MQGIVDIIKELLAGLDQRRKRFAVIGIALLALILLFSIDYWTGWNYYRNLEKKVALLETLHTLSADGITEDPDLYPIYQDIVEDLSQRPIPNVTISQPSLIQSISFWKGISGALFWIIFAIAGFFGAFGKESKIASVTILGFIAFLFGLLGSVIPTIIDPWINYIGFPLLQITIILMFSLRAAKRKQAIQSKT